VLAGFDGAERIVNSVSRVNGGGCRAASPRRPLTLIPSYPDLPMEQLFRVLRRPTSPRLFSATWRKPGGLPARRPGP